MPTVKTIGIVEVAFFRSLRRGRSGGDDHIDLGSDEIRG